MHLTTIAQDTTTMTTETVARALHQIEGSRPQPESVVAPYLVVRGTTRAVSVTGGI
ncbi:hypothetical protein ACWKSP_39855 [Micromonosporaceae bacterium Da 78-11]